jgi:coenzyme F420-reducing hydrogenase delta subunit
MVLQPENSQNWEPLLIGIICENSPSFAMPVNTSKENYLNFRFLRVPCAGRINPQYVLRAFQKGADAVLVTGCPPGECHYISGNYNAYPRLQLMKDLLQFFGVEPERLFVRWIKHSEGEKVKEIVMEIAEKVKEIGPNKLFREEL